MFKEDDLLLVFKEDGTILYTPPHSFIFPCHTFYREKSLLPAHENYCFLGKYQGKDLFAVMESTERVKAKGLPVRDAFVIADKEIVPLIAKGKHLLHWHLENRYSGCCGQETTWLIEEVAKACSSCNGLIYPTYSNIVIALIVHKDQILLARSPNFAEGVYSAIAGFVSPGESLEDAVRREIHEELGLTIGPITYFGSQPWPFPTSLATAFIATYQEGPIQIDPKEIEDARWFTPDALPKLPHPCSLSRQLIDAHLKSITS